MQANPLSPSGFWHAEGIRILIEAAPGGAPRNFPVDFSAPGGYNGDRFDPIGRKESDADEWTAVPIGSVLFAGTLALVFMVVGSFLAERSGVTADLSWWIILVLVSALLAIATPPVAGGVLSCLSILMLQLQIPQEALALGVTLLMLLDFPSTAVRILALHL